MQRRDLGLVAAGALVTVLWYERRRILSWLAWSRRAPTADDAPLAQADTPVRPTPDASEAVAADREAAGDRAVAAALGSWSHAAGSCCKAATAVDALAEAAEAALESIEEASADAPVEIEMRELAAHTPAAETESDGGDGLAWTPSPSPGGAAFLRRARRPSRIDTSFAGRRAARLAGIDIPVAGAAPADGPDPDLSPLLGDEALAALQNALADAPPQPNVWSPAAHSHFPRGPRAMVKTVLLATARGAIAAPVDVVVSKILPFAITQWGPEAFTTSRLKRRGAPTAADESEPVPPLSRRAATLPQRPCRLIQEYAALNWREISSRLRAYFRNKDRAVRRYGEPHTWDIGLFSTSSAHARIPHCKRARLNDDAGDDDVAWGPAVHQYDPSGDRLLFVPDVEPGFARLGYVMGYFPTPGRVGPAAYDSDSDYFTKDSEGEWMSQYGYI